MAKNSCKASGHTHTLVRAWSGVHVSECLTTFDRSEFTLVRRAGGQADRQIGSLDFHCSVSLSTPYRVPPPLHASTGNRNSFMQTSRDILHYAFIEVLSVHSVRVPCKHKYQTTKT